MTALTAAAVRSIIRADVAHVEDDYRVRTGGEYAAFIARRDAARAKLAAAATAPRLLWCEDCGRGTDRVRHTSSPCPECGGQLTDSETPTVRKARVTRASAERDEANAAHARVWFATGKARCFDGVGMLTRDAIRHADEQDGDR